MILSIRNVKAQENKYDSMFVCGPPVGHPMYTYIQIYRFTSIPTYPYTFPHQRLPLIPVSHCGFPASTSHSVVCPRFSANACSGLRRLLLPPPRSHLLSSHSATCTSYRLSQYWPASAGMLSSGPIWLLCTAPPVQARRGPIARLRALSGAVAESMAFSRRMNYLMASTSRTSLPLFVQVKASGTTHCRPCLLPVGPAGVHKHVFAMVLFPHEPSSL